MKKRVISIIVAAVIAGTTIPMISASAAESNNTKAPIQGIWYNKDDPDASGEANKTTFLHKSPSDLSIVIGVFKKGTLLDDMGGRTKDLLGNEWMKVKEHKGANDLCGYIKVSDYGIIYY